MEGMLAAFAGIQDVGQGVPVDVDQGGTPRAQVDPFGELAHTHDEGLLAVVLTGPTQGARVAEAETKRVPAIAAAVFRNASQARKAARVVVVLVAQGVAPDHFGAREHLHLTQALVQLHDEARLRIRQDVLAVLVGEAHRKARPRPLERVADAAHDRGATGFRVLVVNAVPVGVDLIDDVIAEHLPVGARHARAFHDVTVCIGAVVADPAIAKLGGPIPSRAVARVVPAVTGKGLFEAGAIGRRCAVGDPYQLVATIGGEQVVLVIGR